VNRQIRDNIELVATLIRDTNKRDKSTARWSATRKLELRGDIPTSRMGSRSTTPLLRNPTDVRHCSQHAGANVDFGDEGAVDGAFLGNLKQLRALLLG
jgi:hypothetical protein